jgi:hypothetical protein
MGDHDMEAMRKASLAAAILLIFSGAEASEDERDDAFAPYLQRIDKATASSGDFNEINAATQMITPWPPHVHNRHIPGSTRRMIDASEQYKELHKLLQELRALRETSGGSSSTTGQNSPGQQPKQ